MKKLLIIVACVAMSACTNGIPKTSVDVQKGFNCHTDEFAKTNDCTGPRIETDAEQSTFGFNASNITMFFVKRGDQLLIRGSVDTTAGAMVRDENKVTPENALDSDGTQLVMQNAKESRARLCMDGRCYMYAEFELLIDKKWLEKYKNNGVSIRVYTNVSSVTGTQKIPAHYIQGFLDFIKETK